MLEYAEILALLPHGHPMVLLDRVLSLEPGVCIIATKAITGSEPCYCNLPRGLATERYAYPVPLLVESFGQAAAILWLETVKSRPHREDGVLMLAVVRNYQVARNAYPGDVLRHIVHLDNIVGDNVIVTGETRVGDKLVATVDSMVAAARPRSVILERGNRGAKVGDPGGPPVVRPGQASGGSVATRIEARNREEMAE